MADATKTIAIQALWDGTRLKAGTTEAERAVEGLADSVEASSDSMRASLQSIDDGVTTTLGSGGTFSRGVDDVEAEGTRLKEVGTEVGAEFSANLQEGVASGDVKQTLVDTFAGLGAAAGATGQLGLIAAGVGVLLGAALLKGMKQKSEEATALIEANVKEWVAAYTDGLGQIDKATRQSLIRGAFANEDSPLSKIREQFGDLAEGQLGVIGKVLFGTPQMQEQGLDLMTRQLATMREEYNVAVASGELSDREQQLMGARLGDQLELITQLREEVALRQGAKTEAEKIVDVLRETNSLTREQKDNLGISSEYASRTADAMERTADATREAEQASYRLGSNLGNAVRNAGLVRVALGGP